MFWTPGNGASGCDDAVGNVDDLIMRTTFHSKLSSGDAQWSIVLLWLRNPVQKDAKVERHRLSATVKSGARVGRHLPYRDTGFPIRWMISCAAFSCFEA
jgi:hypothetical protein